jgi:hypothetical protein
MPCTNLVFVGRGNPRTPVTDSIGKARGHDVLGIARGFQRVKKKKTDL